VFLNSGIQRGLFFDKPESIDLSSIQTEFTTNYLSYLALTKAFLPFLQSKKEESALI
jgi:short-subunit dehydrogenase involved in D-alanine esterification of teichoic acids